MKRFGMVVAALAVLSLGSSARADDAKTTRLWKAKCSSCHGMDGKAETAKGKKMQIVSFTSPEFKAKKDDELKKAIAEGVTKEEKGVKKEMDGFKDDLTPEQVDTLIAFIRAFK